MTSKPALPGPDARYEAYPHKSLVEIVERNFDPETAHGIADQWKAVGKVLTELAVDFSVMITGSKHGWTGSAAEGARNALLKVGEFSDTAGDQFRLTSEVVREQTYAASEAKAKMPPPVEFDKAKMISDALRSGNFVNVMALPFTIPAQQAKASAARAEAINVVHARDDALHSVTLGMPALAEPPKVTQEQGVVTTQPHHPSVNTHTVDPAGRIGGGTSGTAGSTGTAGVPGALPAPMPVGDGGTTRTSWTAPPTVTPIPPPPTTLTPPTYGQQPVGPPVGQPGWRPPVAPVGPPSGTTRVPPGGGSHSGGGRGPSGRPGFPGGTPGMPGAAGGGGAAGGAGGQGRAVGFGPTGGASFGPTGSQGDAARRAPGMGAMGAAAPMAGQGAQGGEDQEHQTKYLIPTDEYFDDKRMVAPETIGE